MIFHYRYRDSNVCRSAFCILFNTTKHVIESLVKHYKENGPVPREHGNKGRTPHNRFAFREVEAAATYLRTYASLYGLPYPAPPNGKDGLPPILLPADTTKQKVHALYEESTAETDFRPLGLSTFKHLWTSVCPHIKISPTRPDVCPTCDRLASGVSEAVGEEEKQTALAAYKAHLDHAREERLEYNRCVDLAEEEYLEFNTRLREAGLPSTIPGTLPPCSSSRRHPHYTFDYSQAVLIPHHFRQVGPLDFLNPRKIQLFGVREEGTTVQLNYLIDEDQTIGEDGTGSKGPNGVLSMLDNKLYRQGLGEVECHLHADNCAGKSATI